MKNIALDPLEHIEAMLPDIIKGQHAVGKPVSKVTDYSA
jgi:hypothetical protein